MHQPSSPRSHHARAAVRVTVTTLLTVVLAATGVLAAGVGPATASDAVTSADSTAAAYRTLGNADRCVPIRPEVGFYAAGRIGSEELRTPNSRCTTISVSHIRDLANPADRCQSFALGFWPLVDGSLTYTEPVTACGRDRTVLARNVPDNARYIVLYAVDYIEPAVQRVEFRVWH
ncbi:hypothetical protein I0C86_16455 [Plantactinospora sp. S1510]|uniref:Secreted protein n=1 Tax=Plantactinospora alkalitolerans TaxID=2789879 RepID=A0ABS0GWH7_9ACTN|nr:hypothetical protein [Plantactinospora alkalitolerans]MBF9130541.1 hypothetical protein [Plantactinospora alkalitolerans]